MLARSAAPLLGAAGVEVPWYKARWPHLTDRWPAVVRLSERVEVDWFKQVLPISETKADWFPVSGIGSVAAAAVTPLRDEIPPFPRCIHVR